MSLDNHNVQQEVVDAIDGILALCHASQKEEPDDVVGWEISKLQELRLVIANRWPLSLEQKSKIYIGVIASRNLADWTPHIAHLLMFLDNTVKHNGLDVDKLAVEISTERNIHIPPK